MADEPVSTGEDPAVATSQQRLLSSPTLTRILAESSGLEKRQALMRDLRHKTGRYVVTYAALIAMQGAIIHPDDIMAMTEVLSTIPPYAPLDILLSSPGGVPDVTEKLVNMCRAGRGGFRVIVPNYAKSAATLWSLGADAILMGPPSELGPIDPQVFRPTGPGVGNWLPAHAHINRYKKIVKEINDRGTLLPADFPTIATQDVAFLEYCEREIQHAELLATEWLTPKVGPDKAKQIANELTSGRFTTSHGRPIDAKAALEMGLTFVVSVPATDETWQLAWELYVRTEVYLRQAQQHKLFESEFTSFQMRVS
jgi:hypothetical protein